MYYQTGITFTCFSCIFIANETVMNCHELKGLHKQLAELFATSKQFISYHISNILKNKQLDENSVIKDYLITATVYK